GADTITTGVGRDTIFGGLGNDSITSGDGNDFVGAGADNDFVNAANGNDTVVGGGGNDTLRGGNNNDSLSGGDGDDTFLVQEATEQLATDVIVGGTGTNLISFAGLPAVTAVIDFDNVTDVLKINNAGDNLGSTRILTFDQIGETTTQVVVVDFSNSTAAVYIDNQANSSTTTFNITGGSDSDTLNGSKGADFIIGGSGSDIINAGAGVDTVSGGADNDQINVSGAGQQVAGDVINGGSGQNFIQFTGQQAVSAEFDFDNITAVLDIRNALGNVDLSKARDITFSSIIETDAQTVVVDLHTSNGVVSIANNANSSTTLFELIGGSAADVLVGSKGNDTISGGASADSIDVGTGTDRVVATTLATYDTVTNWVAGVAGDNLAIDFQLINAEINATLQTVRKADVTAGQSVLTTAISFGQRLDLLTGNVLLVDANSVAGVNSVLNNSSFSTAGLPISSGDGITVAFVDANNDLNVGVATFNITTNANIESISNSNMRVTQLFDGTFSLSGLTSSNFTFI
ncbi:MAG: calcium-binding protein, partial [Cyanobium sp. LacPavin_0920_WC12_MAG_62_9]|nr:calcium-binding protein [Cyanobium sp. LacPavin_0920_WC12_MAG_62_9]